MVLSDLTTNRQRILQHETVPHQSLKSSFLFVASKRQKRVVEKKKQINWNHGAETED